jgi:membrane carboxypeptidase/penicillin-binding protein PbpC
MQEALLQTLTYRAPLPLPENPAPAFTRLAIEQLGERIGLQRVERGGLVVITSLDLELQNQLKCTARAELERLKLGLAGHTRPGQEDCIAARLLPTMPFTTEVSHLQLEANVIVMVPQSGQVLALVGSAQPGLDPTRLPGHSPGSLYTPFIYLTAFTRGFSPASLVWDIPSSSETGLTVGERFHGPVRLRTAFANDYLLPAAEVLAQVGPENAWRTMQQMGFASPSLEAVKSLPGAALPWTEGETTLLEAAQAFSVLANQGIMTGLAGSAPGAGQNLRPVTILAVTDSSGATWMDCEDALVSCPLQARPVVSPQLAYLVTHVLSDETARWPSLGHPNPLEIGRPAAVKIGRTGGSRGTWVVGYAPQLVGGVWLGPASRDPGGTAVSPQEEKALSSAAASLWHAVMQYSSRALPPLAWSVPAGISPVDVCDPSGLLPTEYCPLVVAEVFLESSVPVYGDTLYREFSVNRETGRLATIFTPPGLVEDRVYLLPPPRAAAWAETAGLPLPPTSYDSIYAPAALSDSARIRSPEMFSHIHGQVRIEGSAQGENFSFYRLQVGKGLNPREWFQIGEDSTRPVRSGLLGYWDTQGLSGLYALRLMVVSTDQRVETSIIQVTLDNQPPALEIVQPASGSRIVLPRKDRTVVFQARAADDTALKTVEFYLNGSLLAATAGEPYLVGWAGVPGTHALRVRAVDLAGNIQEAERIFTLTEE